MTLSLIILVSAPVSIVKNDWVVLIKDIKIWSRFHLNTIDGGNSATLLDWLIRIHLI